MKTKLELIKNYPIDALKNWGDYFGYPEVICKEMTDMVDCDWQNSKIAVLDDFGFQMINFLIKVKNVPLQNIFFLVSETDEAKVELMKKWYSNFVENEISSVYNIDNMFDLILANPPYGKSSSISREIVNKISEMQTFASAVVLAPLNTFSNVTNHLRTISFIGNVSDYFEAACPNLCMAFLSWFKLEKVNNVNVKQPFTDAEKKEKFLNKDFEGVKKYLHIKGSDLDLYKAIQKYNKSHKPFYKELLQMLYASNKKRYSHIPESLIFVVPIWNPADGVHCSDSEDWAHNRFNKPIDWREAKSAPWGIVFEDRQKFENFRNWWYSCLNNLKGKKEKIGLTNKCLEMLAKVGNGGPSINKYPEYFPNLDWSRSWTDKEILKELGLSEDFLEKD